MPRVPVLLRFVLTATVLAPILLAPALPDAAEGPALAPYHDDNGALLAPGVTGGALAAFHNPAAWAGNSRTEMAFWWTDRPGIAGDLADWGFSWGRRLGLAVRHRTHAELPGAPHATDWQAGLALGPRRAQIGLAYRWPAGGSASLPREKALVLGGVARPNPWLSVGASGAWSVESPAALGVFDLGLRPFGTALTLHADYELAHGRRPEEGFWGVGCQIQPRRGFRVGFGLRESVEPGADPDVVVSFGMTPPGLGLRAGSRFADGGDRLASTYALRLDPPEAPIRKTDLMKLDPRSAPPPRAVALDLQGLRLTYRTHRWFERDRVAWLSLSRTLDMIEDDPTVAAVALNLSGFSARPSLAWELRRRLLELRAGGRRVLVHIDTAGLLGYWLASAADEVSMDPRGRLVLPGLDSGRTYMSDLLQNLGVGFEALQFFPHKTAVETLSREDMSAADREQLGRFIDRIYEAVRADVALGRGLTAADFDRVVDEDVVLLTSRARERGLVDRVGRWEDLRRDLHLEQGWRLGPWREQPRTYPAERWGQPPVVAVAYAVGGCEMDRGIRGRALSRRLRDLIADRDVRAVVLRVDSPGGDPLPSDLVAASVRALRKAGVPVVVSQGDVAASGGYWLSMDGARILTTPLTATGSIGVISGWVWDERLHEKLGLAVDGVGRGAHADLFRRVRYPLLGFGLPARGLTAGEREQARGLILEMYDDFVAGVARGRGLDEDEVRRVAGGRVWSGGDAVDRGLCDAFGGLDDALALARELAGIDADEEIEIREFPPRPLLPWPLPRLRLPGPGLDLAGVAAWLGLAGAEDPLPALADGNAPPTDPGLDFLRHLAAARGGPLALLSPGALPDAWLTED